MYLQFPLPLCCLRVGVVVGLDDEEVVALGVHNELPWGEVQRVRGLVEHGAKFLKGQDSVWEREIHEFL